MSTRPTCKVVKREGQRGARIDPKGCKVRTSVSAQGIKTQVDKRGLEKIKRATRMYRMELALAGHRQRSLLNDWSNKSSAERRQYKQAHNILYDTGASVTTMTENTLRHIGYNPDRQTNIDTIEVTDANGRTVRRKVLKNVVFNVLLLGCVRTINYSLRMASLRTGLRTYAVFNIREASDMSCTRTSNKASRVVP